MLIRRKSSTDDEYHYEDKLGVFGVITGASGAVLSSNLYDAFDTELVAGGDTASSWITASITRSLETQLANEYQSNIIPARALVLDPTQLGNCIAKCGHLKNWLEKGLCMGVCWGKYGNNGGHGGSGNGGNNSCPSGTCAFKCPGENGQGCGYPGTTVTCKDGAKIPLPKNCTRPTKKPTHKSYVHLGFVGTPTGAVGVGLTFGCRFGDKPKERGFGRMLTNNSSRRGFMGLRRSVT